MEPLELALAGLKKHGTKATRDGMARYAITADKAFGVTMAEVKKLARELGKSQPLAEQLWQSGWYEARLLASLVGEPARVTPALMDRWIRDFDSWAVCDTVCFNLFDRTPHAFARVEAWSTRQPEFEKRAAFALLASLGTHDRQSGDEAFLACLPRCERAADDERNFVRKAVSWALRAIGGRSRPLHQATLELAGRLAARAEATPRSIGKEALRELGKPAMARRLARLR